MTPFYLAHLVMQLALPQQSDAVSTMQNFETELVPPEESASSSAGAGDTALRSLSTNTAKYWQCHTTWKNYDAGTPSSRAHRSI
jgi:hypothetical protein